MYFSDKFIKKVCLLLIFLSFQALCFAKNHDDWKKWNVTYYDYSDEQTRNFVFRDMSQRMGQLEKLKKAQGTNNALVRELRGVENLYNAALWMWLDYLKLTLCNADGAQYLTDEEIQIYNDIFPSLDIFTSDFCNGVYTNTKDPLSFSFSPDKLKTCYKGVLDSLEQIRHHVNLTYYQKNPSEIPELTKGKKKKQRK